MTAQGIRLRHLAFHGPYRPPARVDFGPGLNVIYGASNTGKSFIVDSLDFMLGGRGPLRDIPERVGYDRILLAFETLTGAAYTLQRSVEGGPFRLFDGFFSDTLPADEGRGLADQHNDRNDDNLSAFLLSKIGLSDRKLRRNKLGATQSLSIRNIARLIVVNEEEIIQQRSPLSDGNYVADTANTAVFKLLITGVDDSALEASNRNGAQDATRDAQVALLDEMIKDYTRQLKELAGPPKELEEQLTPLEETMKVRSDQLSQTEEQYRVTAGKRRELLKQFEEGSNRHTEVTGLLERFSLLEKHYRSDIDRLRGIEEAGTLFSALGQVNCPLCGATPEHHLLSEECDGNVDSVVAAARVEIGKIELRQGELRKTIALLSDEARSFERRMPLLKTRIEELSSEIEKFIAPTLRKSRAAYSDLADKRTELKEAQAVLRTLEDLKDRRNQLLHEGGPKLTNYAEVELSTSTVHRFSETVKAILEAWNFPELESVHFDLKIKDLVINGKSRVSFGKGLRAITQSAFTIGLLEYCRNTELPHPGIAILDSPLLSYREPENAEDDLRGSDLNAKFYHYLMALPKNRQVIIIENTDPPVDIQKSDQVQRFTKLAAVGRAGLFPA